MLLFLESFAGRRPEKEQKFSKIFCDSRNNNISVYDTKNMLK